MQYATESYKNAKSVHCTLDINKDIKKYIRAFLIVCAPIVT